jgi:hypothetical protein
MVHEEDGRRYVLVTVRGVAIRYVQTVGGEFRFDPYRAVELERLRVPLEAYRAARAEA